MILASHLICSAGQFYRAGLQSSSFGLTPMPENRGLIDSVTAQAHRRRCFTAKEMPQKSSDTSHGRHQVPLNSFLDCRLPKLSYPMKSACTNDGQD